MSQFYKRFLKASKSTRRAFPGPQPFTTPNFPLNIIPQYKPAPHTPLCSHMALSFRGNPCRQKGKQKPYYFYEPRFCVNHQAARNRAPKNPQTITPKKPLSLLIHPRERQSKSSITALSTAQTFITVFTQIPSQIHKAIKKQRKKMIHICKLTSNKSATEQLI